MLHKEHEHKRSRRVSNGGGRATVALPCYAAVLLLCLETSSATAVAAASTQGTVAGSCFHRSFFGVDGGGEGDGGDEKAPPRAVCREPTWTAVTATEMQGRHQQQPRECCPGGRPPTVTTESSAVCTVRDRFTREDGSWRKSARGMLVELRGGSEGLKSEHWSQEKASKGRIRHLHSSETTTSSAVGNGRTVVPTGVSTSPPAIIVQDEAVIFRAEKAATEFGVGLGGQADGEALLGAGVDESELMAPPPRSSRRHGGEGGQRKGEAKEEGDEEASKAEFVSAGKSNARNSRRLTLDRESLPGTLEGVEGRQLVAGLGGTAAECACCGDGVDEAAGAATGGSGGGATKEWVDGIEDSSGRAFVRAATTAVGMTARDDDGSCGTGRRGDANADDGAAVSAAAPPRKDETELSHVGVRGRGGNDGSGGGGGGGGGVLYDPSEGRAAVTETVRRRRNFATPAEAEEPRSGTGTWTGRETRGDRFPRAGAPPPPRGEVRVWRPWGRHGAVEVPPVGRDGDSTGMQKGTGAEGEAAARWGGEAVPRGRDGETGVDPALTARVRGEHYAGRVATGVGAAADASTNGDADAAAETERRVEGKVRRMRWEPKYLTVKAVFFLFYSSLGAIMPYLPVYYHSLGIADRRIGHLGAITPAMTFIFTPLWGALTDKSGMLKQILVLTFAASTLLRVSLAARTSFLWIISVITMTAIVNAPVRPLLDSSALQSLDNRAEYGKQRLWGQWGFGIGSFLTGRLLSRFGFTAAFYMHAAFSLPTLLILLRFSPKKEDRGKEPPKFGELYQQVVHDPDVLVFFSMVFAIGLSSGVIENFAYKRLRELGGTGSVLGVSRLVSSLSGIPMFFFSGAIVKRFSIVGILTASMMSFIARFVIYASIKNPWAGLPAEALRGVTFAGFWAASTCHVGAIAPPGLSTTMLGLLNATYGGIGQSLGSLIGGSLSMRFGTAKAFLVYAAVDACLLLAFFLFWGLHPNGHQKNRGVDGGISSSSSSSSSSSMVRDKGHESPSTSAPRTPAAPLQNQTFSPPSAVNQR